LIAVVALTSVAGCSLALSGPEANRPRSKAPECDTGKGLIALDGVFGSVFATSALVALSEDAESVAAVTGLIAAAYLGAAFRGNTKVNECRDALAVYNTQTPYDPGPEEPTVATRPSAPARTAEPAPSALPPEYAQPQPPAVTPPPVAAPVPPPPSPIKTVPPWKESKTAPPRPVRTVDAPADWRDFWTEVP
jgi:hypothetical protein